VQRKESQTPKEGKEWGPRTCWNTFCVSCYVWSRWFFQCLEACHDNSFAGDWIVGQQNEEKDGLE